MVLLPKAIAANKKIIIIMAAVAACIALTVAVVVAFTSITASPPPRPSEEVTVRYDRFGVREIYPTKESGQEWYLNPDNPLDGMFVISPAATPLHRTPDGSWLISRETAGPEHGLRMYVTSPLGWSDIEMTGYVKLKSFSFEEEFAWAARSGKHSQDDPCDATAYFGALEFVGNSWFQKKIFHGEGYTDKRFSELSIGSLTDRWIGIKLVAYNVPDGVRLELWVDDRAENNWVKMTETIDSGGWSSETIMCGRAPDHIIAGERPRVMFRVDNATFEFKSFSVREIQPAI